MGFSKRENVARLIEKLQYVNDSMADAQTGAFFTDLDRHQVTILETLGLRVTRDLRLGGYLVEWDEEDLRWFKGGGASVWCTLPYKKKGWE
jgi:hypothetical protein